MTDFINTALLGGILGLLASIAMKMCDILEAIHLLTEGLK